MPASNASPQSEGSGHNPAERLASGDVVALDSLRAADAAISPTISQQRYLTLGCEGLVKN